MTLKCIHITLVDITSLLSGRMSSYFLVLNREKSDPNCSNCFLFDLSNCRMDYGEWTENSRGTYNKWDGIARTTTQVLLMKTLSNLF